MTPDPIIAQWYQDPGFRALPDPQRRMVISNYFNSTVEKDDEFLSIPFETQQTVRDNFVKFHAESDFPMQPVQQEQTSGLLGAFGSGVQKTISGVRTAANVYSGDDEDVNRLAQESLSIPSTPEQKSFQEAVARRTEQDGDDGIWQAIKNIAGAAWEQPLGALHETVGQLPNSAVVMGSMAAGAAAGTVVPGVGNAVGAIAGGILGLLAGNIAIETGFIGQEQAVGGQYDREAAMKQGAIKGGVITGVDVATMGLTAGMFKAASGAGARVLRKAGIDPLDDAAVMAALKASPDLQKQVMKVASSAAVDAAPKGVRALAVGGVGLGLESVGEGAGEYLGSKAAGLEASFTDAVMEAVMSMPQSVGTVAVSAGMSRMRGQQPTDITADTPIPEATRILSEIENDLYSGNATIEDVQSITGQLQSEFGIDPQEVNALLEGYKKSTTEGLLASEMDQRKQAEAAIGQATSVDEAVGAFNEATKPGLLSQVSPGLFPAQTSQEQSEMEASILRQRQSQATTDAQQRDPSYQQRLLNQQAMDTMEADAQRQRELDASILSRRESNQQQINAIDRDEKTTGIVARIRESMKDRIPPDALQRYVADAQVDTDTQLTPERRAALQAETERARKQPQPALPEAPPPVAESGASVAATQTPTAPEMKGRELFTKGQLSELDRLGIDVSGVTAQYKTEALQQIPFNTKHEGKTSEEYNAEVREQYRVEADRRKEAPQTTTPNVTQAKSPQPTTPPPVAESADVASSDQSKLLNQKQMLEDMIATNKSMGRAVNQAHIDKLASINEQLAGDQEGTKKGPSEGIASDQVFGHPQATNIMPEKYGNLIPIRVDSIERLETKADAAQKAFDEIAQKIAMQEAIALGRVKATPKQKKAAKAYMSSQQAVEDATIEQLLFNETMPELSRLRKILESQAEAPKPAKPKAADVAKPVPSAQAEAAPAKPKKERPRKGAQTLRGRIKEMGGINFGNFKGELKVMPRNVEIALARNKGIPLDTAEDNLKSEGWLGPEESLLELLLDPEAPKRGKFSDIGEGGTTEAQRLKQERFEKESIYEAEEPPPGDYVEMTAEDLPEGKTLTIIDGNGKDGWDEYKVIGKDPFGVTLEDGVIVELRPGDKVQVRVEDLPKDTTKAKQQDIVEVEESLFDEPQRDKPKPVKKESSKSDQEQKEMFGYNQSDMFGSGQQGIAPKGKGQVPAGALWTGEKKASIVQYPSGRFGFVGHVDSRLVYEKIDTGESITAEEAAEIKRSSFPALTIKSLGVREKVFATEQEAIDFAESLGIDVAPKAEKAKKAEAKPEPKADEKVTDSGEELWYNKRNRMGSGVSWDDVKDLNSTLQAKEVTKTRVWPRPNYESLVSDGMEPFAAHMLKQAYDAMATTPPKATAASMQHYISEVQRVREALFEWAKDRKNVIALLDSLIPASGKKQISLLDLSRQSTTHTLLDAVYPDSNRSSFGRDGKYRESVNALGGNKFLSALQPGRTAAQKAVKDIGNGWPAPMEAWQKQGIKVVESKDAVTIKEGTGIEGGKSIPRFVVEVSGHYYGDVHDSRQSAQKVVDGFKPFLVLGKYARVVSQHTTREDATEAARGLTKKTDKGGKITDFRIKMAEVTRKGPERRSPDENITSDRLKDTFGFKGVNFGNWTNQNERQAYSNAAYDAMLDLADILKVPPQALSLNGMLGLAFGAQGGGKASAHFVPGANEINLTKTMGAGTLAHEFGHALDHYFANQAELATIKEPYLSHHTTGKTSGEIRAEIADAFRKIVETMKRRPSTEKEMAAKKANMLASSIKSIEGWLAPVRKELAAVNDEAALKEFDDLAGRLKSGDMGEGYAQAGKLHFPQVVAQMRNLIKDKVPKGRDTAETWKAVGSWASTISYAVKSEKAEAKHIPQVDTDYLKGAKALDSAKKGKAYWTKETELFARAFETYVVDKLAEDKRVNDYLSYPIAGTEAYPVGSERAAINAAFDKLIGSIKTKQTPKGTALFSRRNPQTQTKSFREWFGESKVADGNGEPLVVYHGTHAVIDAFKKTRKAHLGFHFGDQEAANTRLEDTADKRIDTDLYKQMDARAEKLFQEMRDFEEALRKKDKQVPASEIVEGLEAGIDIDVILEPYKYKPTPEEQAKLDELRDAYQKATPPIHKIGTGANIGAYYLSIQKPLKMFDVGNWGSVKEIKKHLPWDSDARSLSEIQEEIMSRGYDGIVYQNRVENPVMRTNSYIVFKPTQIKSATGNKGTFDRKNPSILFKLRNPEYHGTLSPEEVDAIIDEFTANWKNAPPIKAAAKQKGLPKPVLDYLKKIGAENDIVDAVFYDGTVWVVSENLRTKNDVIKAIVHESFGHYGVRGALGKDLNNTLARVYIAKRKEAQAIAKEYGFDLKTAEGRMLAADEWLAREAANNPESKWVDRVVSQIREWLRKVFPKLRFSEAEIRNLLDASRRYVEGGRQSSGSTATAFSKAQVAPQWYSQMQRVLESKLPGSGSGQGMKKTIQAWSDKGEFKADELSWVGLNEWLDSQDGKVTKQEILDYVAANNVQLVEVTKGDNPSMVFKIYDENDQATETTSEDEAREAYENGDAVEIYNADRVVAKTGEQQDFDMALDSAWSAVTSLDKKATKFDQYQEPGAENYREMLLTLPSSIDPRRKRLRELSARQSDGLTAQERAERLELLDLRRTGQFKDTNDFKSQHWDEPNVLVHVRLNDRTGPNGEKILFVEEVQSDLHQAGRKSGYRQDEYMLVYLDENKRIQDKRFATVKGAEKFRAEIPAENVSTAGIEKISKGSVPNAPFKGSKNWSMLAIKRLVRMAAEQGYDSIAWTPGDVQAARYDLSKQIDKLEWERNGPMYQLWADIKNGDSGHDLGVHKPEELENVVGKEVAQKIIDSGEDTGALSGLDLKVGGEGMKGFYDKILPAEVNKFFNKAAWGKAKVGTIEITATQEADIMNGIEEETGSLEAWNLPITPEMRQKALREGMPLFQRAAQSDPNHKSISEFNKEYPGHGITYDGIQEGFGSIPDHYQLTARDGTAKGATFLVRSLDTKAVKAKLDEMVEMRKDKDRPLFKLSENPKSYLDKLRALRPAETAPDTKPEPPLKGKYFPKTKTSLNADDYAENRRINKSAKSRFVTDVRMTLDQIVETMDKYLGSISTRLGNVNSKLKYKMRELGFLTGTKSAQDIAEIYGGLKRAKTKMSRDDFTDFDYARKNSDKAKIDQLIGKYGLEKEYAAYRKTMDRIRQEALDVGMDVGFLEDYTPRILKDQKGFLKYLQKGDNWDIYSRALKKRADEMGLKVHEMSADMKADIISNMIANGMTGLGGVPGTKARKIELITPEINRFYMHSDAAIVSYVLQMRKHIEIRKFFGKVPEKVSDAKRRLNRANTRLKELQESNASDEKIQDVKDNIRDYERIIENYKHQRDYTENIGGYIAELLANKEIKPYQEKVVHDILHARFHERGATGMWAAYKNLSYIDTMGSPISALTQIGDLAWAAYDAGMIRTLKNVSNAIRGKSLITKESVGIERMAQEFADSGSLANAVNKVFKLVGLEKMDSIGKEALLNGAFQKYASQAKKNPKILQIQITKILGKDASQVVKDLAEGKVTNDTKLLVYNRLLDFQPVALSEMPQAYLSAGNGRLFYMLKTFTIKQFDAFRNEAYNKIKYGNRTEKLVGIKNLTSLAMLFVLANAGADELKDWLLGRKTSFEDRTIDNVLRLFGISKFITWEARKEGIGTAAGKQILPPFKFVNSLYKDLTKEEVKTPQTIQSIPIVGKIAYWHMRKNED